MSTPDAPGAVNLTAPAPASTPAPTPQSGPVPGALVAGIGALALFALPALAGRPRTSLLAIVAGIALVIAGALIAARPGASRGAVIGWGVGTLVVQLAFGQAWRPLSLQLVAVLLLGVGLGLTWCAARGLLRSWWMTLLPGLVFAVGLVINALAMGHLDSSGSWQEWSSRTQFRLTELAVGVALVVAALLAERRGPGPSQQEQREALAARYAAGQAQSVAAAQAAQVAQIQQWQAAWAAANPGQPASAAPAPPMPIAMALPVAPGESTNTMAVLALVFGLLGSGIIPVVLGHISLGQIGRTGERGRGMAVGGLVLGYLELAVLAAVIVSALSGL